jgi:hypothetical protein
VFFVKRDKEPRESLQAKYPHVFDDNDREEDILEAHEFHLVLYYINRHSSFDREKRGRTSIKNSSGMKWLPFLEDSKNQKSLFL